ncbi:MAG: hypothetical protein C3F15_03030 [Holophagae bacterium]|nr:MAG: hypothetical protein C3F15_03030 [Holophagae bacterium]
MEVADELVGLIHQIRNTASPIERLKLLARGWRSVRALSADDRRSLARELGFDGAEQMIDQLARRGGMSPSNLMSVLHEAEQTDPAAVLDTIRGLGEPERRRAAAGELLDTAADILVDDEAQPAHAPGASGEPTDKVAAEHGPPAPSPQVLVRQRAAPPAVPAADSERGQPSRAPRADAREAGAAGPGAASVRPPAAPARQRPPAVAEKPGTRAAPEVGPRRVRGDRRPAERAASPAPPPPAGAGLATQLGAERSLLRRLRRLAASAGRLDEAGIEEVAAVLECFPAGWARRRALQRLLEAGVPRSTSDAITLLELLPRPSERLWAATTLAASRPLDDGERAALLAAVPSPALRHRLERRLAAQ